MRHLFLTSHSPCGPASGSQLRCLHLAEALEALGSLDMVIVGAEDSSPATCEATRQSFNLLESIPVATLPRPALHRRLANAMDPRAPYPHGLAVDPADETRILNLLPQYDLVWFYKLRVANFFAQWRWPNSVVDIDDIPSTYERAEKANTRGLASMKAGVRAWVWERRERLLGERFNALCVCSEPDKRQLRVTVPVHVIPNGYATPARAPRRDPVQPPRIGFIGLFDHIPNAQGIQWFVRECWPRIQAQIPDARLRLVGKGSDTALAPSGPDIDRLGWVADAEAEIASWSAMIVPIQLGAGTRVKIPDAFSRQCPVVSTRLGAYGYELESGRELLLADDPAAFAEACIRLVREPALGQALATRAYNAFLKNWTWEAITPRIHAAAESVLSAGKTVGANLR